MGFLLLIWPGHRVLLLLSGSCFSLTLPFTVGRETETIQPATTIAPTVDWDGPPLRVLFAEDDQVNIKLGSSLLKKMWFDVTIVENGRGGFDGYVSKPLTIAELIDEMKRVLR
jgi:hypothetical protein